MHLSTARLLIDLLARHLGEQNDILATVCAAESPEEVQRIQAMIAQTMGAIVVDGLRPLLAEYPELTPVHLRKVE